MAAAEFVLGFAEDVREEVIDYTIKQIAASLGKQSVRRDFESEAERKECGVTEGRRFLIVQVDKTKIEKEAQHLGYLKPRSRVNADGSRTKDIAKGASSPPEGLPLMTDFQTDSELFDTADPSFWKSSEEVQLLGSLLDTIPCGRDFEKVVGSQYKRANLATKVTPKLIAALRIVGALEVCDPLHVPKQRAAVGSECRFALFAPVDTLQQYFGWNVAYYFEWMNHFTTWLLAPAVFGLIIYFHNRNTDYTVDDNPYLPFFSLFVVLWAVCFVCFWERRAAACAWRWGVYAHERQDEVRPQFRGELVDNERDIRGGGQVRRYPYIKRLGWYGVSALVTGVMLCVAFSVMVCSLNLQGYIDGKLWWERPLHIEFLAALAQPGAIFDPNQTEYMGLLVFVPVVLHVVVIMILNRIYRTVAETLTDLENHRLEEDHENSLILKRFFFEAFDCYIALFYVGFVQQDIRKLRSELMALYTVDSLRRVATETLLPQLMGLWNKRSKRKLLDSLKKHDKQSNADAILELEADEYESFDDYLEMVIEFGYVILFAAGFPLASALSVLCNVIEMKSDLWKLTRVYKRPKAVRASNIGVWRGLLWALVALSVFTNVALFATSEQLAAHFPELYREAKEKDILAGRVAHIADDGTADLVIQKGKGRYVVLIAVGIEHIVYIVAAVVANLIPREPEWVTTQVARLEFEKDQALREQMSSSRYSGLASGLN
eukprot:Hpha_TRINITY_DN26390_c0_g1::TRINITY_DN26390_c0_g1_i1::g.9322::m.9322/K19327/ANO10, TMEM16K; anoctamin-10